ncbi:hypothetical protein HDK77DRAFT_502404 [Phyllosticta capitalensis]
MPPDTPMPTARSPPTFNSRLLSLPNELQDMILAEVDDSQPLLNVSLTNRHLQAMAEPHLYRDVFIKDQRGCQSFFRAIVTKSPRATYVRQLSVDLGSKETLRCQMDEYLGIEGPSPSSALLYLLDNLDNLENLFIKSGGMNWDFYKALRQASRGEILPSLKTCEMFALGDGLYAQWQWPKSANYFQPLLLHPTLEELTLINVAGTPGPLLYRESFTCLQKLELLSSAMTAQDIKDALSYSTCLKELTVYPDPKSFTQDQWESAPDFTVDVFESVKDSLHKLVIYRGIPGTARTPMNLHTLTALRHLAVADECLFGSLTGDARMEAFTLAQLKTIFPPNLEIWEIQANQDTTTQTINPILTYKDELCPRLQRISAPKERENDVSNDDLERLASAGIALTFDIRFLFLDQFRENCSGDDEPERDIVICSEGLSLPISYLD